MRNILRVCLLSSACLLACNVVFAEDAEENIQKSFSVTPGGKLIIEADRGSIEVGTGGEDKLEVQILRKVRGTSAANAREIFENHQVTLDQEGNMVAVKAKYKGASDWWFRKASNLQVRYQVTVPKRFNLDFKTAGGSVNVADLDGEVRARTAGGSIKLGSIEGKVFGHTAGGSITVAGCKASIEAETAGGSIKVGSVQGEVKVSTSGGSISVENCGAGADMRTAGGNIDLGEGAGAVFARTSGGSIRIKSAKGKIDAETAGGSIRVGEAHEGIQASTSGGSIDVSLAEHPSEDCKLETAGGSIQLSLPANISVNVDAKTSGGRVTTDLPVTVQGEQKRGALQGKIGEGGKLLTLRASAGSIEIKKR